MKDMAHKFAEKAYAVRVRDRRLLEMSSSGGAFTALTDRILEQGGAVACAVYNYGNHQMEYELITDRKSRDRARGSKYVQSVPGTIFVRCLNWLKENPERQLLFVGMGCQTAGFGSFAAMHGLSSRVLLVDIICHGSPSPLIWNEYVRLAERQCGGQAEDIRFKDKRKGWLNPTAVMSIWGQEKRMDDYVRIFYNRSALRPACHRCPYAAVERNTDLTIGDFWGIDKALPEFYDPLGTSLVLVHSRKGEELFGEIREHVFWRESSIEDCLQPNLQCPTPVSPEREQFWTDYQMRGISYVVKKYGSGRKRRGIFGKNIGIKLVRVLKNSVCLIKNRRISKDFSEK